MICQGRLFTVLGLFLVILSGCNQGADSADNGTSGWTSLPVKIYSDASVTKTPGALQDFTDAMAFWEARAGRKLFDYQGAWSGGNPYSGTAADPGHVTANVILFQSPWPYATDLAGQTTVEWSSSQIQSAMIMINAQVRFCPGDCAGVQTITSQRRAIAHELGHFLGLGHVQDKANIMYPQIQPGGSLDDLQIDSTALQTLTQGR